MAEETIQIVVDLDYLANSMTMDDFEAINLAPFLNDPGMTLAEKRGIFNLLDRLVVGGYRGKNVDPQAVLNAVTAALEEQANPKAG